VLHIAIYTVFMESDASLAASIQWNWHKGRSHPFMKEGKIAFMHEERQQWCSTGF